MVNSANPGRLYAYFNTLAGLFDRMVLKKCQEKRGDSVTPMPGGLCLVRQSLYPEDDRCGEELQEATPGVGELPRVWGGLGEEFTGCAPPNLARYGKGGTGVGGRRRRQGQ